MLSLKASLSRGEAERSAGARPDRKLESSATTQANASAVPSTLDWSSRGTSDGPFATIHATAPYANRTPTPPLTIPRTTFSVSS